MFKPYMTMVVVESEKSNLTLTIDGEHENDQAATEALIDNLKFLLQCLESPGKVTGELSQGKRFFLRHQVMTEDEQFPVEEAILA